MICVLLASLILSFKILFMWIKLSSDIEDARAESLFIFRGFLFPFIYRANVFVLDDLHSIGITNGMYKIGSAWIR